MSFFLGLCLYGRPWVVTLCKRVRPNGICNNGRAYSTFGFDILVAQEVVVARFPRAVVVVHEGDVGARALRHPPHALLVNVLVCKYSW